MTKWSTMQILGEKASLWFSFACSYKGSEYSLKDVCDWNGNASISSEENLFWGRRWRTKSQFRGTYKGAEWRRERCIIWPNGAAAADAPHATITSRFWIEDQVSVSPPSWLLLSLGWVGLAAPAGRSYHGEEEDECGSFQWFTHSLLRLLVLLLPYYRIHCETYYTIAPLVGSSSRQEDVCAFCSSQKPKRRRRRRTFVDVGINGHVWATIEFVENFCQVNFNLLQMLILTCKTSYFFVSSILWLAEKSLSPTRRIQRWELAEHPLWRFVFSKWWLRAPHYSLWWATHFQIDNDSMGHIFVSCLLQLLDGEKVLPLLLITMNKGQESIVGGLCRNLNLVNNTRLVGNANSDFNIIEPEEERSRVEGGYMPKKEQQPEEEEDPCCWTGKLKTDCKWFE